MNWKIRVEAIRCLLATSQGLQRIADLPHSLATVKNFLLMMEVIVMGNLRIANYAYYSQAQANTNPKPFIILCSTLFQYLEVVRHAAEVGQAFSPLTRDVVSHTPL